MSKMEETSGKAGGGPQSQNVSSLNMHPSAASPERGQRAPVGISLEKGDIMPKDSRSITPNAAPRSDGLQKVQFVNGGDIDVMEFKINEVTNNPVPTDIFTFKKLVN